jgi:cytochrome P450 family 28
MKLLNFQMKWIYPLLEDVSEQLVKFIEKQSIKASDEGLDAKDVCMRFTLNNVGSCAFGLEAKCFEEDNNEFRQIADRFFTPEGWQTTKVFIVSVIPFLSKFISIK